MNTEINTQTESIRFNKNQDWTIFTLRRIGSDYVETDTVLGGFYSFIRRDKSESIFNEIS